MTTLIIDGDILAYRAACRVEKGIDWGDGLMTLHSDAAAAIEAVGEEVIWLEQKLKAERSVIALSDPTGNYFRLDFFPAYKQNRKGQRKPLAHKPLLEHIRDAYKVYQKDRMEADDVIGILATHPKLIPGDKIVVSIDKDFLGVPCRVFAGKFDEDKQPIVTDVDEPAADHWHLMQTLMGDTVDGYPGCPGMGKVRAERLLADAEDPWGAVVAAFEKAKMGEEEALVQARCARILRYTDYDFKRKEAKLWTPHSRV